MSEEKLSPLEALEKLTNYKCHSMSEKIECKEIIEHELKVCEMERTLRVRLENANYTLVEENIILKDKNKLLRESNENLDATYFDTWYACEQLKRNSDYALMFVDNTYCFVNTKDNKFDVVDKYKINNYGIIDNGTKTKLKAFDILKDYLYIDDKNTLRLRNTTNVSLAGIIFSDREVIDLLKEVLL